MVSKKNIEKTAICYASDGGDYARLDMSVWSVRKFIGDDIPIYVLTENHWQAPGYNVTSVCPTEALWQLGFFDKNWGRRLPFATLYRLAIPLMQEFKDVDRVIYLDTDTLVLSPNARKLLIEAELSEAEISGVPDVSSLKDRNKLLMTKEADKNTVAVMSEYWEKWGTADKKYINAGMVVFNLKKIRENGLEWYKKRMKLFWNLEIRGKLSFLDQDAINMLFDVDYTLDSRLNAIGMEFSVPFIRHYAGGGKVRQPRDASIMGYVQYSSSCKIIDPKPTDLSNSKQLILYICHIVNEETLWRYRRLKEDVSPLNMDVLWVYNQKPGVSVSFPDYVWYDSITDEEVYAGVEYAAPDAAGMSLQFQGPNYMAMKMALKYDKYDYVWYLEYDVCYSGNWKTFFDKMNTLAHDFICERVTSRYNEPNWFWWKYSREFKPWNRSFKSVNCISRLSRRFINALEDMYRSTVNDQRTFFEHAWVTLAMNEYSCYDLYKKECAPVFSVNKINNLRRPDRDKLYHAIKDDIKWAYYC